MNYANFNTFRDAFESDPNAPYLYPEQIDSWGKLINMVLGMWQQTVPGDSIIILLQGLNDSREKLFGPSAIPENVEDLAVYLPPLNYAKTHSLLADLGTLRSGSNKIELIRIAITATAVLISELSLLGGRASSLDQALYRLAIESEANSYGAWKVHAFTRHADELSLNAAISKFAIEADAQMNIVRDQTTSAGSAVIAIQEKNAEAIDRANKAEEHLRVATGSFDEAANDATQRVTSLRSKMDRLDSLVSTADGRVEAFIKTIKEELGIDATKVLWKLRARGSTAAFWVSAIALAIFLFMPLYIGFNYFTDIIGGLEKVGDATIRGLPENLSPAQLTIVTISRLVIISVPLLLYFWAIRLIVRFNTRSLVLMDDARFRHTMMDTYFHLVEKGAASTEERALILNALFRPTPGTGNEASVEPPKFTDFMTAVKAS